MAKEVIGFLSEDNVFFESAEECELYEAEDELRRLLEKMEIDDDKFINYITMPTLRLGILRYFSALIDQSNKREASENNASIQQQSPRGDEPVPDVGSGSHSEGVR